MKTVILILLAGSLTACATPDGVWYPGKPIPGYGAGASSWTPMAMPGQTTVVVNGGVYKVYSTR
jgi:hypothetical protein